MLIIAVDEFMTYLFVVYSLVPLKILSFWDLNTTVKRKLKELHSSVSILWLQILNIGINGKRSKQNYCYCSNIFELL